VVSPQNSQSLVTVAIYNKSTIEKTKRTATENSFNKLDNLVKIDSLIKYDSPVEIKVEE
jgi:hypothetical protein